MGSLTLGLDLGQATDPSALVIVDQYEPRPYRYDVRHMQRWPLGTPYPQIVADTKALLALPVLAGASLVIDATGVGRPVCDMFHQAGVWCAPIVITAGSTVTTDEYGYLHTPKKELVSTVQLLLQSSRLKVARSLAEAKTLLQELTQFQAKITVSANEVYGQWREGQHDDLVLALALALWYAERYSGPLLWGTDDD